MASCPSVVTAGHLPPRDMSAVVVANVLQVTLPALPWVYYIWLPVLIARILLGPLLVIGDGPRNR